MSEARISTPSTTSRCASRRWSMKVEAPDGATAGTPPGYHWIILSVLFVSRFCLGFQFQSAGSVGPFLMNDLGLDYSLIGTLIGLYMLPGLIVALPGGMLGDRYGDKRMVLIGLCVMILGGAVSGAAISYATVSLGRVISGVGAAILVVLMNKMIIDWFAEKQLFIGMSIYIIGWPVGIAAAQATQGQIAQAYGWSAVFYLTAVALAVPLALMTTCYRPAPIDRTQAMAPTCRMSRNEVWLICVVGWIWMTLNCAYFVLLSFGPVLIVERGYSVVEAGRIASIMSWVFFFALPLGGYLATRFKAPNVVMVGGLAGSVLFGLLIPLVDWPHLTFALFGIAFALATPVIGSLPSEALKRENRATGFGIYYLWYYGGVAVAPAVGGLLKDATNTAATSIHFATAMMLACLLLLGLFRVSQSRGTLA
jgi:MFS family permease